MVCNFKTYFPGIRNYKDSRISIGYYIVTDWIRTGNNLVLGKWERRSPLKLVHMCLLQLPCFIMEPRSTRTQATKTPLLQAHSLLSSQTTGILVAMHCPAFDPVYFLMETKICTLKEQPSAWKMISLFIPIFRK